MFIVCFMVSWSFFIFAKKKMGNFGSRGTPPLLLGNFPSFFYDSVPNSAMSFIQFSYPPNPANTGPVTKLCDWADCLNSFSDSTIYGHPWDSVRDWFKRSLMRYDWQMAAQLSDQGHPRGWPWSDKGTAWRQVVQGQGLSRPPKILRNYLLTF